MGTRSKKSSAAVSTLASIPLPRPKLATSFAPRPLTPSEIDSLRREGREFQEAYSQIKANLALNDAWRSGACSPVDIGIILGLEEEFRELVEFFGPSTSRLEGPIVAHQFEHGNYRLAATFVGDMGEGYASRVTNHLRNVYRPESIVTLGIAASMHIDARIGDVFIPEGVVQYIRSAKVLEARGTTGAFRVAPGSQVYRADDALRSVAMHLDDQMPAHWKTFRDHCAHDLEQLIPNKSLRNEFVAENLMRSQVERIIHGYMATGPVTTSTEAFSQWVQRNDRNVMALEMESSAAVWFAAHSTDNPIKSMTIRGIADYADERRKRSGDINNGILRRFAFRNSIRFFLTLLDANMLPSRI